jgi:hypothetical protein
MGAFSTNLKGVANKLLTTYGQSISFVRWVTTEYNTATGGVDPVTSTTFSGLGHPSSYKLDEIDGQTIQVNDVKMIVYSTSEPKIEDEATVDSVVYRVMNVDKLQAQGEAIVYRLQLRV